MVELNRALPGVAYARPALRKWRAALARVRSGSGNARMAWQGDSTLAGFGSTGSSMAANARSKNPAVYVAQQMTALGVRASNDSFFGNNGAPDVTTYDTRIAFTGTVTQTLASFGNNMYLMNSTGQINFTPDVQFDRIEVITVRNAAGTLDVGINGGAALQTINVGGAGAVVRTVINCTLGTHIVNLKWASGTVYVIGCIVYRSDQSALLVMNGAISGANSSNFVGGTSPWDKELVIQSLGVDLTLVNCTINDARIGTPLTTYRTRMQTIITQSLVAGDVMLMLGVPDGGPGLTTQPDYEAVVYELAATNGLPPPIDMRGRYGSYALGNALGLYSDNIHQTATGYAESASAIAEELLAA